MNITRSFSDGDDECVIDQDQNLYVISNEHSQTKFIRNVSDLTHFKGAISSIVQYKQDLFIGFRTGGAVKLTYTPDQEEAYTVTDLNIRCGVLCIMRDKLQNIIWMGTDGQGVYRYTEEEYTLSSYLFSEISPEIQKSVRAILRMNTAIYG